MKEKCKQAEYAKAAAALGGMMLGSTFGTKGKEVEGEGMPLFLL